MHNKESCRKCGFILVGSEICPSFHNVICEEIVSWSCKNCCSVEVHIHSNHQYISESILK
jgi:hypothetical protein